MHIYHWDYYLQKNWIPVIFVSPTRGSFIWLCVTRGCASLRTLAIGYRPRGFTYDTS